MSSLTCLIYLQWMFGQGNLKHSSTCLLVSTQPPVVKGHLEMVLLGPRSGGRHNLSGF